MEMKSPQFKKMLNVANSKPTKNNGIMLTSSRITKLEIKQIEFENLIHQINVLIGMIRVASGKLVVAVAVSNWSI